MFQRKCLIRLLVAGMSLALVAGAACEERSPASKPIPTTEPVVTPPAAQDDSLPNNLLARAAWEFRDDQGSDWRADIPVLPSGRYTTVHARVEFEVEGPARFATLELSHGLDPRRASASWTLNEQPVWPPVTGMYYKTLWGIPANLLRPGKNVLGMELVYDNRQAKSATKPPPHLRLNLPRRLIGRLPEELEICSGPVLGPALAGELFTLACRTNMPAEVTLSVQPLAADGSTSRPAAIVRTSPQGLMHRFRIQDLPPGTHRLSYALSAVCRTSRVSTEPREVVLPAAQPGKLRLAALGDSRTNPDIWADVAAAVLRERPELVVFGGDMVASGRNEWEWDRDYFKPAAELLAAIPYYPVIGNHEEKAELYKQFFWTPSPGGKALQWAQVVGPVMLVGIDGRQEWSPSSANARWLDRILAKSDSPFVLVVSHYPALSSSKHGQLDLDSVPVEATGRAMLQTVLPILLRHEATAFICGHDHLYERSDIVQPGPDGRPRKLAQIIAGAAGAPLYKKVPEAAEQNPYSRVFASVAHYTIWEIDGQNCTMIARTPEGKEIDRMTFTARVPQRTLAPTAVVARP